MPVRDVRAVKSDHAIVYNPLQLEADPYPVYRRLRAESPVYRAHAEGVRFWALSRFADVEAAAIDWATFSSADGNDLDDTGLLFGPAPAMDCADPPVHTRMRGSLRKEFAPGVVRGKMESAVRGKVRALLDELSQSDTLDFADDLAYPLPAGLICGLLGIPEPEHKQLRQWHAGMLERDPGKMALPSRATSARDQLWEFFKAALADRRAGQRDDVLSVFARAQLAGDLSEDEALANILFLFDAGIVSTCATIASALLHLRSYEDQWLLLRRSPEIIPAAVEEFLRFDAPFHWFKRVTTRQVELHDITIPAGERVLLIWASANRDERRWEDPERLILNRPPQRHMSFNTGIHHCLGVALARLELRILFEELAGRLLDYELTGPVKRRVTPSERTIVRMPASVQWARQP